MQTSNPYILQAQELFLQVYEHPYFQYIFTLFLLILAFFTGRLLHTSKLQHLLDMINDSDTTKKLLSEKLTYTNIGIKSLKQKRNTLRGATVILILLNGFQIYMTKNIDSYIFFGSIIFILFIWSFWHSRMKYLNWIKNRTQEQLKATTKFTQMELKQILQILGPHLQSSIKRTFQTQFDMQWIKQAKQQCKLMSCHREKTAYQNLYNLYESIIKQIKQVNLCGICIEKINIDVHYLNLNEVQILIRNCRKALKEGKITLERKKEMVNRLLGEWKKVYQKLGFICKRGCCIKQRNLIEQTKIKNHDQLKRMMSQLNS